MAEIKAIDRSSVARICSGQVITDLGTAVKELVENSLDAGAKHVEVKLKDCGLDLIEVSDNGSGVSPSNHEGLALKYHTSKLSSFSDLVSVASFGFRGEALSSLCELAGSFTVTTRTAEQNVGVKLTYGRDGKLLSSNTAPRQVGTTVSISNLFQPLPVRRGEFKRNIKKQYNKLLRVLQAYAIISVGVRMTVTNAKAQGGKQTLIGTQRSSKLHDNVTSVFGAKFLSTLMPLEVQVSGSTNEQGQDGLGGGEGEGRDGPSAASGGGSGGAKIWGLVSKAGEGVGRSDNDRQFLYINGRPVDLPKVSRALNEVWRQFEMKHKPAVIVNLELPAGSFDVNVTPDKREIFMTNEVAMIDQLKEALVQLWTPSRYTMPVNQGQLNQAKLSDSMFRFRASSDDPPSPGGASKGSRGGAGKGSPTGTPAEEEEVPSQGSTEASPDDSDDTLVRRPVRQGSERVSGNGEARGVGGGEAGADEQTGDWVELADGDSSPPSKSATATEQPSTQVSPDSMGGGEGSCAEGSADGTRGTANGGVDTDEDLPEAGVGGGGSTRLDLMSRFAAGGSGAVAVANGAGKRGRAASPPTVAGDASEDGGRGEQDEGDEGDSPIEVRPGYGGADSGAASQDGARAGEEKEKCKRGEHGEANGGRGLSRGLGILENGRRRPSRGADGQPGTRPPGAGDTSGGAKQAGRQQGASPYTERVIDVDACSPVGSGSGSGIGDGGGGGGGGPEVAGTALGKTLHFDLDGILGGCRVASDLKRKRAARAASATSFSGQLSGRGSADDKDSDAAARAFSRVLKKDHFKRMRVIGQFNLGFIICQLGSDLFILDQHACDEKYNFETLQRTTTIHQQPLVRPLPLEVTAAEEMTIADHLDIFEKNGFRFQVDEDEPTTKKLKITAVPFSKGTQFGVEDVHELASIVAENPGKMARLPKARAMFASRACRSSIMIGTALERPLMGRVVKKMAEIEQPWNCPHGRPTMRHLADISKSLQTAVATEGALD